MLLISGAAGNLGGELVRLLAARGEPVRALTRTSDRAGVPDGVEVVAGDLNEPASIVPALTGVRGVFVLAGYADMPGLLAAVRDAGVERVVLLSSGAVAGGDVANAVVRYNIVSEAAVYDCGVAGTILRPSGFHSNALRWLAQLREGNVIREPFANVPVASIDPLDIAAVAALALTEGGHERRTYRLTGPEPILPAERVRILAEILGRELTLEAIPDVTAREEMSREMPTPYVDAFFNFFVEGAYDDGRVDPTTVRILGRPARTFEQWAHAHIEAFQ
jgi:uncharacterized protein YbjT (DUF2867 family)